MQSNEPRLQSLYNKRKGISIKTARQTNKLTTKLIMSKLIQEFKEFAVKGNAVDMAVGVIIGGAFGKIVSSIVDDIIMPPIGWLIGGVNFSDLKYTLPQVEIPGVTAPAPATINYGNFLQTLLDFIANSEYQSSKTEN